MYLITGSAGQLGNELKLILGEKAVYVDREELDICDEKAVSDFFAKNKFEAIINCAAYTAVDKAESDFDNALKVNSVGPSNLAKTGVPLVHISTDYVFDGSNFKPYVEEDKTSPTSVYGDTKLKGEQAVFEKASDVFEAAKQWVEKRCAVEKMSEFTVDKARKVMDDKRNHTLAQIEEAEEILSKIKVQDDELPF